MYVYWEAVTEAVKGGSLSESLCVWLLLLLLSIGLTVSFLYSVFVNVPLN